MAKGGKESARPSYGRSKLTLIQDTLEGVPKSWSATILKLEQNPPERMLLGEIGKIPTFAVSFPVSTDILAGFASVHLIMASGRPFTPGVCLVAA